MAKIDKISIKNSNAQKSMLEEYLIAYTEAPSPKDVKYVMGMFDKEKAFEQEFILRNRAWNIKVFKRVQLNVEVIERR